ncbi:MAG: hypothetical protein JRJ76_05270 [Deltaproteobacteria bacterium]|nr:hypothetical protein [Deltaproteobacteria bacterium]MBW1846502.1 hypothetical protein [Deltaproteobacteria bacterium]
MIVTGKSELRKKYAALGPGDVFIGGLAGKGGQHLMLVDLLERGIKCYPSPLSQMLNGSKVAQTIVLNNYMSPHTFAISRRYELMEAISKYNQCEIGVIITKADKMHCGHGVRKWENIEMLYSYISHSDSEYPFVLQPFIENFMDVRVIIAGDYIEAYTRENLDNFRQNISAGGRSFFYELNQEQKTFCEEVMDRGKFPYGHIDLQVVDSDTCYLSEIALNGGIKGASIQRNALDEKKKNVLERLASESING